MRKLLLVIAALSALPSAAFAAFAIFQTYSTPQIFYNIVTDGGAACNGDVQTVIRTTSISSGSPTLTVTVSTFSVGDVGKTIRVPGAGSGGGTLVSTILASPAPTATQVTLANNAGTTLSSVSKDITFGTDDADNFMAFNTWARANQGASYQVVLTVPNGSNCWFGTAQTSPTATPALTQPNMWAAGINNLVVEATGATLNSINGSSFSLSGTSICGRGITDASGCSARLNSVSSGSSTITLTGTSYSAGYISRFSVGGWVAVTGLDIQGQWNFPLGRPPNAYYFEFRQVASICNNTAGCVGSAVITLDRPLTNSYLDTWPLYTAGSGFESDQGGPATVYSLGTMWGNTVELRGATVSQANQMGVGTRNGILRNVRFTSEVAIPSVNETWSAYNVDYTGLTMEVDKLIGTMLIDGITINVLQFQSASVDTFTGRNMTVNNNLTGGAKFNDISDSTIATWFMGTTGYGNVTRNVCTRCKVTTFDAFGGSTHTPFSDYSKSSGVLSFPNTAATGGDPAQRRFAPAFATSNIFYMIAGSFSGSIGIFGTNAVTQDATNTYVQTTVAGGFPTFTSGSGATCCSTIRSHPSPQFTNDNPDASSDPRFLAMSVQNGATPLAPVGQFSKLSYAPTSTGSKQSLSALGTLVKLSVNVTTASTHTGVVNLSPVGSSLETVDQSGGLAWVPYAFAPVINLKQAGLREITPSGVTCNGVAAPSGCSGDSISTPPAVWIKAGFAPLVGGTFGGGVDPQFTITIETNQGVVP